MAIPLPATTQNPVQPVHPCWIPPSPGGRGAGGEGCTRLTPQPACPIIRAITERRLGGFRCGRGALTAPP